MDAASLCSEHALNEDVLGTAINDVQFVVAIEVRGSWAPKAPKMHEFTGAVAECIDTLVARTDCRTLFMKRRGKRTGCTVFFVDVIRRHVHRFDLDQYEDLPSLPWTQLFEQTTDQGLTSEYPLLVCTHNTRDHCCGLHGPAVARALEELLPGQVWQCSHLGGHRFAATLLALPWGLHFGKVRASEVPELVDGLERGQLYNLERYRGCIRYPTAVQAAIDTVRRTRMLTAVDEVTATSWSERSDEWSVLVDIRVRSIECKVSRIKAGDPRPASCGATPTVPSTWQVQISD